MKTIRNNEDINFLVVWGWGVFFWGMFFMGVSVDKLNTYLLGEGQFDLLAGWFSKTIGTFVDGDR